MTEITSVDELCRICISNVSERTVSIYSPEGKNIGLHEKIFRLLSILVEEEDCLPKIICLACKNKLDSFEQFRIMARKSQTILQQISKSDLSNQSDERPYETDDTSNCQDTLIIRGKEGDEQIDNQTSILSNSITVDDEIPKSLLHSILTDGQVLPTGEITEMEVTIDPMLFFDEDEGIDDKKHYNSSLNVPSEDCGNSNMGLEISKHLVEPKPYQCYLCPRGFNSDVSLKSHLWNHMPSRKILANSDLNRHEMQSTFGTRMFNSHCLCQDCGRVYPSKSTLRAHQITHSNLRPHKCSLCDKTFKRNQDLKFHINQHTGERPYRCPYCPKAFASSGNCFSHRKRMHPKQLARDKKKINK